MKINNYFNKIRNKLKKKAEGLSMQTIVVAIIVIIVLVVIIGIFITNMGKTNNNLNKYDLGNAKCVAKGKCALPLVGYDSNCGSQSGVCKDNEVCCLKEK